MWNTPLRDSNLVRIYRIILWDLFLLCLIATAMVQVALLIGYLFVLPLHAAPIPRPRPPVTDILPGTYSMKWGSALFLVTLSESGHYSGVSTPGGHGKWEGKWDWDRRSRTLYIRERHVTAYNDDDGYMDWAIHLDMTLRGKTSRGYYDVPDSSDPPATSFVEMRRIKIRK